MNIIGSPYSILLSNSVEQVKTKQPLANCVLIQAQDGDVCYRLDGGKQATDGFILPQNELLNLSLDGKQLSVWSTERGVRVRLVVQEIKN